MMPSSILKEKLVDMAVSMRDEILTELSVDDPRKCEICGDEEFQKRMLDYTARGEDYSVDCPRHNCDGRVGFWRLHITVGEQLPVARSKYLFESCSHGCTSDELNRFMDQLVEDTEPVESEDFIIPMQAIATNRICRHHISYEPEITMDVCSSCHAKIHHDDEFRPDLQPDMKRAEWEAKND